MTKSLSPGVKPCQHLGREEQSGWGGVQKDGVRAVAGFGETRKHKWAMHFGKPRGAHTQFICLLGSVCEPHHGGASNCTTRVMSRKKSVSMSLSQGGGSVWKQGGYMETGRWASHPFGQHVWSQAEQTHPTPASGTTDARSQITRHQNHLSSLCLFKLLWVCQQLSYVSPAWSPAFCSEQPPSCFCAKLI